MTYEKYITKYRAFCKKWDAIRQRNENGDYSHGSAIYGPLCDKIITFDDDAQKAAYSADYGL